MGCLPDTIPSEQAVHEEAETKKIHRTQELDDIFLTKIREYNERKEMHDHYIVALDRQAIIKIAWNGRWSYKLYPISEVI